MRFCRALSAFFAVLLCLAPVFARAQYSAADVVFEGGAPYSDAELLTVSGLAPGQLLAHDSLANAAQHLLDTGLFSDAQVFLSGQGKSRTIHVALKPIPLADLLPVGFENLVWFTPDELTQGLHARIPLYRGFAPEAGTFQETIQAALLDMLKEKSIAAKLSYQVAAATVQHPARVVEFAVAQPSIRLADVHLSLAAPAGAAAKLAPGFQVAVNRAVKSSFNEGLTGTTIADLLLPPVRNFGYITAHLDHIERTFTTTANGLAVTYTARVVTGEAYTVAGFAWQPTAIYSAADFARDAKLHPGELADVYALNESDTAILSAYLAHGYMDAVILANPSLDETAHTVTYAPKVIPGEIYRVKSVTPTNLSADAQKEFDGAWRMKPGEPYAAAYVDKFIQANTALVHLAKYTASYQASADPQTHLVDLAITFTPAR